MKYDLNDLSFLINTQAVTKRWRTDALFCIKKAEEELKELKEAIIAKKPPMEIALEGIDNIYMIIQAVRDSAPNISLTTAFDIKYQDNWNTKKKTEDEDGNPVRR